MDKATVNLFFDTRKIKANGKYPVKLTVYFDGNKKRYNTNIDVTQDEWVKLKSPKLKDLKLKQTKLTLQAIENRASKIIEKMDEFSFDQFSLNFLSSTNKKLGNSFTELFKSYIDNLKNEERIGSATSYNTTLNSITEFKKNIKYKDLTPGFLYGYEKYLLNKACSTTTVGIYMRQLRAIVNKAIDDGMMKSEEYPFKQYVIPGGRNIKKALSFDHIKILLEYQTEDPRKRKALDLWLFSYLANGMNMADIAYLKHTNINGDFLNFIRTKTKRTKKRDLRAIKVALNEKAKAIIERYKTDPDMNPFLFGILQPGLTAVTEKNRIRRIIKFTNKLFKEILKELNIDMNVRFGWARHSFSTVLKRKGISTDFIKESLGHSSSIVTENYLDSFEDTTKIEYSKILTEFEV